MAHLQTDTDQRIIWISSNETSTIVIVVQRFHNAVKTKKVMLDSGIF